MGRVFGAGVIGAKSGFTVTPDDETGATINSGEGDGTYGAYTEIIAATTQELLIYGIYITNGDFQDSAEFEIATGAAASEVVKLQCRYHTSYDAGAAAFLGGQEIIFPLGLIIPAGSRVAVRCRDNNAAAQAYTAALLSVPTANLE